MQKSCYKKLINPNGDVFCDTLKYEDVCVECITRNTKDKDFVFVVCPKEQIKSLVAQRRLNSGVVYACGQGYGKNSLFVYDLDCLSASLTTLSKTKNEVERYIYDESVTRIRRVFHNIRSINAHSLQEIRTLIPETVLKKHKDKSCKDVEDFIKRNIEKTAQSIFRISKDLYEIKAEFSIYDKLIKGEEKVNKRPYNIRDVIMIVLYPFFEDFNKKGVVVNVDDYYESIPVDFETFQVALYHIIENASKYIKSNTNANIAFRVENGFQLIEFKMQSLYINQEEQDLIFNEGYSGTCAHRAKLNGEGIGMYRAKRLIELNNGTLSVVPGKNKTSSNNLDYATNIFVISLPLNNE